MPVVAARDVPGRAGRTPMTWEWPRRARPGARRPGLRGEPGMARRHRRAPGISTSPAGRSASIAGSAAPAQRRANGAGSRSGTHRAPGTSPTASWVRATGPFGTGGGRDGAGEAAANARTSRVAMPSPPPPASRNTATRTGVRTGGSDERARRGDPGVHRRNGAARTSRSPIHSGVRRPRRRDCAFQVARVTRDCGSPVATIGCPSRSPMAGIATVRCRRACGRRAGCPVQRTTSAEDP
ncbi:hypothetical protein BURK1_02174 [Burkholderiales bacterium]|nr:hypothetical protein BURK1_02174 [Burkholderiales bacterium]